MAVRTIRRHARKNPGKVWFTLCCSIGKSPKYCGSYCKKQKQQSHTRWFNVTCSSHRWRSHNLWWGHLTIPKRSAAELLFNVFVSPLNLEGKVSTETPLVLLVYWKVLLLVAHLNTPDQASNLSHHNWNKDLILENFWKQHLLKPICSSSEVAGG